MRLLHVEGSPRRDRSVSTGLAREVVERAQAAGAEVDRLAVWEEALPEFDGPALTAKYVRLAGGDHDPARACAWAEIGGLVERVDAADALLISTPMWNFGIPYRLKHWIDLITQPGLSFTFDPTTGYAPLLRPRPVAVILASAGDYSTGPSWGRPDLASFYLEAALGFIGLASPHIVRVGPTAGDAAAREAAIADARRRLESLDLGFGSGR